ncbi:MAG: hypothetical protein IKT79_01040, partial [Akkermansia sp.]|nr:hypothetical protein [Akkermansia sp.]
IACGASAPDFKFDIASQMEICGAVLMRAKRAICSLTSKLLIKKINRAFLKYSLIRMKKCVIFHFA